MLEAVLNVLRGGGVGEREWSWGMVTSCWDRFEVVEVQVRELVIWVN